jgi:hypothetical protein
VKLLYSGLLAANHNIQPHSIFVTSLQRPIRHSIGRQLDVFRYGVFGVAAFGRMKDDLNRKKIAMEKFGKAERGKSKQDFPILSVS